MTLTQQLCQIVSELMQAKYVSGYHELKSVISVHETFCMEFGGESPVKLSTTGGSIGFSLVACLMGKDMAHNWSQ